LAFWKVGGWGRFFGRSPAALLIAACTSCAAPSMLRDTSNCSEMLLLPSTLDEDISVMPGISASCRSSGTATVAAMVSALAPGRAANTWMVGISTCGTPAIGNCR
jgi:hypothetical protein